MKNKRMHSTFKYLTKDSLKVIRINIFLLSFRSFASGSHHINLENQFNYKALTYEFEASGWNLICFDEYRGSIEKFTIEYMIMISFDECNDLVTSFYNMHPDRFEVIIISCIDLCTKQRRHVACACIFQI